MAEQIRNTELDAMTVVFVGHVDHGKSTIVGRLLADTGMVPEEKLARIKAACADAARPFEYAFLIDALKDERAQNITIDAARVFFQSAHRQYLILDAPGHVEFVKNMVTGAAHAETALLVIDAHEGVQENSRRHGYLLWMLGIKKVLVLVNKMDRVDYAAAAFEAVTRDYGQFLAEVGITPLAYLPVSGYAGDNVVTRSPHMLWYTGPTVLEALDALETDPPPQGQSFRMPVQDVYKFTLFGDARRIVAGRVSSGTAAVGDEVVFYPSAKRSVIKSVEGFNQPPQTQLEAGQSVGFTLAEQIYVGRGEVAVRADQPPPQVADRIRVSLFWLGKAPMEMRKEYWLKLGTAKVRAKIDSLQRVMDAGQSLEALAAEGAAARINRHEVAECVLALSKPIAFDLSAEQPELARFVLVDNYEICGGGLVLAAAEDTRRWVRESVMLRNLKWEKSDIPAEHRAEKYNQRATLILITGPKGVGRKKVAKLLEAQLFESGKIVYYLATGSVVYGVDADLKGKAPEDARQEHMRRLAEVAHILLDAGVILIVTSIELTQNDLEVIKTAVDDGRIETVWIGDQVTTDVKFDVQLPGGEQAESSAIQIKRLLQEHGAIFRAF
jgi:bifunctional enzyme CysN/CysC